MEGIQGGRTSNCWSRVHCGGVGARTSSLSGIRASQEETKKLSKIVRNRMTALSVTDSIRDVQFVESQSEESVAEWEQLPGQTVGALYAKIFTDSVMYQRPQTICAMSHGSSL